MRSNLKVSMQAAEVMGQMEHLLNVYAARAAPHSVAHFLGYIEVTSAQATRALTEGLWLVRTITSDAYSSGLQV